MRIVIAEDSALLRAGIERILADAGLVDRYNLLVFPYLLGAGERRGAPAVADSER